MLRHDRKQYYWHNVWKIYFVQIVSLCWVDTSKNVKTNYQCVYVVRISFVNLKQSRFRKVLLIRPYIPHLPICLPNGVLPWSFRPLTEPLKGRRSAKLSERLLCPYCCVTPSRIGLQQSCSLCWSRPGQRCVSAPSSHPWTTKDIWPQKNVKQQLQLHKVFENHSDNDKGAGSSSHHLRGW